MGTILLGIVFMFLCIAIVRIAWKVRRQWNSPSKEYRQKMEDIQRRKRELGITDDEDFK